VLEGDLRAFRSSTAFSTSATIQVTAVASLVPAKSDL
jgi:hypothetical protein